MQKVYRLLRNNQETGPYSLDEILLLNLKAFDLVWVDGKSAAWRYPSEIEALKPFVPAVPHPQSPFEPVSTAAMETEHTPVPVVKNKVSKNIFVSMPEQLQEVRPQQLSNSVPPPIEQKDRVYAGLAETDAITAKETIDTKYSKSLGEMEEDYTNWVYNQKSKQKPGISKKDLAVAALLIFLIIGGYLILSKPSIVQPVAEQTSTPLKKTETATIQNTGATPAGTEAVKNTLPEAVEIKKKKTATPKPVPVVAEKIHTLPQKEINEQPEVKAGSKEAVVTTGTAANQPEKTPVLIKEKKKKFGEVVKGIFTKKDKKPDPKEETVLEQPQPATNRQATKRAENENTAETNSEALANMVDITSNAPENWMMGVTGLKVTVRNRNNVVLQTAAVQVLYYDENDQLLDRKSVYFNNVPARGKTTMSAPDHKFADHVGFKILAISAKEDHYASN